MVDFENPPSRLILGYEAISELITSHTQTIMPALKSMQFSRMDFEVDRKTLDSGQVALPKFILERRANVGFEQERWFSSAPMQTADHLEVLSEIEKLAANL